MLKPRKTLNYTTRGEAVRLNCHVKQTAYCQPPSTQPPPPPQITTSVCTLYSSTVILKTLITTINICEMMLIGMNSLLN